MKAKAIFRGKYGSPEVLETRVVELPTPAKNEVTVKVMATTVNRTDCANLTGKPFIMKLMLGYPRPRRKVMGTDYAGEVVAVGSGVTEYKIGDRVWGFNDSIVGSQAQFMNVSTRDCVLPFDAKHSFEIMAASAEGAFYAYNFINKISIKPGDQVCVNGGTGAIGSAIIQFAKVEGARIMATCRTEHVDLVKSLGADECIDYTSTDFTQQNQQFDFVLDSVGKSSFGACKPILKEKGIYISSELGPGNENIYLPLVTAKSKGKRVIFPLPKNIRGSLQAIYSLIEQGSFTPLIDQEYNLNSVKEAYAYALSGKKVGNLLLKPNQ